MYIIGVFVITHDITLDDTTDVLSHPEFVDRKKTEIVNGVNTTGTLYIHILIYITIFIIMMILGYFVHDFTVNELKTLRVKQVSIYIVIEY
jgi:glycerophosphoryl diester phosphodiesterase